MNLERHIINSIKQQNNISDKDVEIYEFGLHLLILKLFHISCILFIGYVGREFFKVILFLLLYSTFRKYAGGYHSQTHIGCLGISIISTICFIVFLKITLPEFVYRCMWVISAGIIWILAPQDTENRRLNNSEIRYFRKKSKNIVCIYSRNLLGGLYRENPVKSRNYEAVKSSKKWENVGNSYIIPALLLYRYSYI